MRRTRWAMLWLALALPARAEVLEGGWTHDLDLSAGFGAGQVTTTLSEVTAFGLFGGRIRLGAGPRLLGVFGGSGLEFSTADADLIAAGKTQTVTVSQLRNWALNLAISLRIRVVAGLELGANIDVVGVGFGPTRTVNAPSGAFAGAHPASPPTLNLLALGRKDQGTLDSEFFVGWWFGERVLLRAGAMHVETELVTAVPLEDGNDRFRRTSTLAFVALGVRL